MRNIIVLAFLLLNLPAFAQSSNSIMFEDCSYSFLFDDGSHDISFKNAKTITQYISDATDIELRKAIKGQVDVQLIVFSDGKACCKFLTKIKGSFSLHKLRLVNFENAFNALPNFTIGKPEKTTGTAENYSAILKMIIKGDGTIEIFDYSTNKII